MFALMHANSHNYIEFTSLDRRRIKKTHREVYGDAVALANHLCRLGCNSGSKVGLLCKNRYEVVVLDLACVILGIHFVCFHYEDFKDEALDLPRRFDLSLLFLDESLTGGHSTRGHIVQVGVLSEVLAGPISKAPEFAFVSLGAEDVFTTVFTSGSTGVPKGLEVRYGSIEYFIRECLGRFEITRDDRALLFLPLSQYSSRLYVYSAITLGFDLVLGGPDRLLQDLKSGRPTILQGVPYVFEGLYDTFRRIIRDSVLRELSYRTFVALSCIWTPSRRLREMLFKDIYAFWGGRVRFMVTGAAPIRKEVLQFYNSIGLTLFESYGLVETGIITLNSPGHHRIGSAGKVLPDKKIRIDENSQILVRSEHCWGRSYVHATPDENAKTFVDDGWIATGDLGRVDADGYVFLNGRIRDVLVLSNGTKVSPSLIEQGLNSSLLIKQSAVLGSGRPFLVAVVVKKDDGVSEKAVRAEVSRINRKFADTFKVRDIVLTTTAFSVGNGLLTGSLKLDRRRISDHFREEVEQLYQ